MDAVSYIPLSSPVSTIWPLPTTGPTNYSSFRDTLPSDMMLYLDGQPIIKTILQGIPISSCSTVRQIQTAPCYDIVTFTATLCTTIENAAAAATVNSTQCTTTIETATQPRFWNNQESRGGSKDVSRKSAQLLTYITGEPIYAPTPDAQAIAAFSDLPLSEARIAAIPGATREGSHGFPVETQAASVVGTGTAAAATSEDDNTASLSSVLGGILLDSGLQASQDGPSLTGTQHLLESPALPTTSPQRGQVDVFKIILAIVNVASELKPAYPTPQGTASQARDMKTRDSDSADAENTKADDTKDVPPPTGAQGTSSGMVLSNNAVSEALKPSQENDHDTSMKPLIFGNPPTATPTSPSIATPTRTLAPGSILPSGSVHLSALPDASGLALSDGSTLRLKDGETAEITFPDGLALRISRSGTVYLLDTRTADMPPQITGTSSNGASDSARATGQTAGGNVNLLHGGIQVSVSTAMDGPADHIAGEVSTGAALVCLSDVRGLVAGVLLLVFVCLIVE